MPENKISIPETLERLAERQQEFVSLFQHGSLAVEIYKPDKTDRQQPHDRDEIYVIISGSGKFYNNGEKVDFGPGDFLFVPAGHQHYFYDFTDDFATWVFFYGPKGGELLIPDSDHQS